MNTSDDWVSLADDDFASAEFLANNMHPVPTQIVCFLSQQAGEKYLKGYLSTKLDDEPPYTHDVNKLCRQCETFDASFSRLIIASSLLGEFAVKTRYDRGLDLSEEEMRRGLKCAKEIHDFVIERLASN